MKAGTNRLYLAHMTVVIDKLSDSPPPEASRHSRSPPAATPRRPRKPDWIRVKAPVSREYTATRDVVRANNLHTVCEEAACTHYRRVLEQAPRHHDDHWATPAPAPAPSAM